MSSLSNLPSKMSSAQSVGTYNQSDDLWIKEESIFEALNR